MSGELSANVEAEKRCVPASEAAALIESLIRDGVAVRIQVHGASMEPAIRSGDYVLIAPAGGRIRMGDILLCRGREASAYFLHRAVWHARAGEWRTKGDALQSLDPPVTRADVLGRVQSLERGDGTGGVWDLRGPVARMKALACAVRSLASAALGWCVRRW
jgi:hypothetical protein